MGSTIERQTMLMKKNWLRETTTLDEHLGKGTDFKQEDMSAAQQPMARAQAVKMSAKEELRIDIKSNIIKDYQNFLSQEPF